MAVPVVDMTNYRLHKYCIYSILNVSVQYIITGIWSLIPLLVVKILHLVDSTDLFKISSVVWGGKEIVTSQYSSLEGQRQFMVDIVSKRICCLSVSKLIA